MKHIGEEGYIKIHSEHPKVKVRLKETFDLFPVVTLVDGRQFRTGDHMKKVTRGTILQGEWDCTGQYFLYDIEQFEYDEQEFYGGVVSQFFRAISDSARYFEILEDELSSSKTAG